MKKTKIILTLLALTLILSVVFAVWLNQTNLAHLKVYAAGNPDAHGNKIQYCYIYENGSWLETISTSNYTQGQTIDVESNVPVYLVFRVYLNNTFADDSDDAVSKTRVYLNVTGEYINENLASSGNGTDGSFYYVDYGSSSTSNWTTATDTTYTVDARFDAYY